MKIDFEFDTEHGKFVDAIHIPDGQTMSDEEVEALKQLRLNSWLYLLNNPMPFDPSDLEE